MSFNKQELCKIFSIFFFKTFLYFATNFFCNLNLSSNYFSFTLHYHAVFKRKVSFHLVLLLKYYSLYFHTILYFFFITDSYCKKLYSFISSILHNAQHNFLLILHLLPYYLTEFKEKQDYLRECASKTACSMFCYVCTKCFTIAQVSYQDQLLRLFHS